MTPTPDSKFILLLALGLNVGVWISVLAGSLTQRRYFTHQLKMEPVLCIFFYGVGHLLVQVPVIFQQHIDLTQWILLGGPSLFAMTVATFMLLRLNVLKARSISDQIWRIGGLMAVLLMTLVLAIYDGSLVDTINAVALPSLVYSLLLVIDFLRSVPLERSNPSSQKVFFRRGETIFLISTSCLLLWMIFFGLNQTRTLVLFHLVWFAGMVFLALDDWINSSSVYRNKIRVQKECISRLATELGNRTAALKDAKERSDRIAALQRDFLATMSHELRSPIASLIGLGRMLAADASISAGIKRDLGTMERLALMMLDMVDDGLAYVRDRGAASPIQRKPTDMRILVRDLESVGKWLAKQQGNTFRLLPPTSLPSMLELDERRLRQIIINLLSNAGRFCSEGEISLGLQVQRKGRSFELEWIVADSGKGIDTKEVERLFEPFVKSHDSTGIGLGLAVIKRLTQEIGGTIKVLSNPGMGAYFVLTHAVDRVAETADDSYHSSDLGLPCSSSQPDITEPMALMDQQEIGDLDLDSLKKYARLGQLTEIEHWLTQQSTKSLSVSAKKFLTRISNVVELVDLDRLSLIISQAQSASARSGKSARHYSQDQADSASSLS